MDLKDFKVLELEKFKNETAVEYLNSSASRLIYPDDSALKVFRDFKEHKALTVYGDTPLLDIKKKMIECYKDFVLVTDSENKIIGSISLNFIQSTLLPQKALEARVSPNDLTARDIQTRISQVNMISYSIMQDSKVGHILNTISQSDGDHLIVYDTNGKGQNFIRGYFSLAYIRRRV